MDIYKTLLQKGVKMLLDFKKDNSKDTSTGLENDILDEPYFSQILELNKYVHTNASTNEPANNTFQNMFLVGLMHKKFNTSVFRNKLKAQNLSYAICDYSDKENSKIFHDPLYSLKEIVHDMLFGRHFRKSFGNGSSNMETFGKFNSEQEEEKIYYTFSDDTYKFVNLLKTMMGEDKTAEKFTEIINWINIPEGIIEDIKENTIDKERYLPPECIYWNHEDGLFTDMADGENKKFVKQINKEMIKGNIVQFEIWNDNPMDRNLYLKLLKIFKYMDIIEQENSDQCMIF